MTLNSELIIKTLCKTQDSEDHTLFGGIPFWAKKESVSPGADHRPPYCLNYGVTSNIIVRGSTLQYNRKVSICNLAPPRGISLKKERGGTAGKRA